MNLPSVAHSGFAPRRQLRKLSLCAACVLPLVACSSRTDDSPFGPGGDASGGTQTTQTTQNGNQSGNGGDGSTASQGGADGQGGSDSGGSGGSSSTADGGDGSMNVAAAGTPNVGNGGNGNVMNPPQPDPTLLERLVPFQEWHEVSTDDEGLLYVGDTWASAINWGRGVGDGTVNYWYSADGSSPYAIYFASSGEGENFLADWQVPVTNGEGQIIIDAAMFGPTTPNPWGLSEAAHIIRVEPNNGKGGTGIHFVATDITVLDGTDGYPADPGALLADLRTQFDGYVTDNADAFEAELAAAETDSDPGGATLTTDDLQNYVALWPTWMSESKVLRATFIHEVRRAWEHTETIMEDPYSCPPGAPCLPPPPPYDALIQDVFGVQEAVVFDVDASGTVVKQTEYPVERVPQTRTQTGEGQFF